MKYINKKTRIIILSTIIFTIIATMGYITYGYVSATVSGNTTGKKVVLNGQILRVSYSGGTESLDNALVVDEDGNEVSYFKPGTTLTKTFTIKNTGNVNVNYSIRLKDVVNDFERLDDLTYEIKNGEEVLESGVFPNTDTYLMSSDSLSVNESKTYTLVIKYLTSEENQIVDTGKTISGEITIEEATKTLANLTIYGNSVQDGEPTPETPVEIESLGNPTKNLFNKDKFDRKVISNVTVVQDDSDTFIGQGNEGASAGAYSAGEMRIVMSDTLEANKTYTFSIYATVLESGIWTSQLFSLIFGSSYQDYALSVKNIAGDPNNYIGERRKYTYTFTPTYNLKTITFRLNGCKWKFEMDTLQIEEGDTATDYEPYGYNLPIKVTGKNLYNPTRISATSIKTPEVSGTLNNGYGTTISTTDAKTDRIVITQTSTSDEANPENYRNGYFNLETGDVLKENKKYKLSMDVKVLDNPLNNNILYIYPNGEWPSTQIEIIGSRVEGEFTYTRVNGCLNFIEIRTAGKSIEISNIMITEVDEDSIFELYKEPKEYNIFLKEPLRKVGDCTDNSCVDYIDFNTGSVARNVQEQVFTGSESWAYENLNYGNNFYLNINNSMGGNNYTVLSNMCKYYTNGDLVNDYSCRISSSKNFNFRYQDYSNITEFKNKLIDLYNNNNPLILNYILNTGKNEMIYNLPRIETFDENSNISVCSSNGVCASDIVYEIN